MPRLWLHRLLGLRHAARPMRLARLLRRPHRNLHLLSTTRTRTPNDSRQRMINSNSDGERQAMARGADQPPQELTQAPQPGKQWTWWVAE
ncbi:hypothetical protein [Mycolicibacterium komossense]|uniref:hypothetical protein n=1 Tax=Mycolicibacterium komossense TaxID=1779 RepID=UPI0021F2D396|nr:hypothetical protein [Mycolicibacterium komossense]